MVLHEKTVLQFSGGKDSLACLLLLQDRLDEITVMWADSGDAFPETLQQMEIVKSLCPHFVVVNGNQPEVIKQFGYPADILPVKNYVQVQHLTQQSHIKIQPFIECCQHSLLVPMHEKTLELGATMIIRGQKLVDKMKSPVRNGDVIDGITYCFPIEHWTDAEVLEYVSKSSLLPAHYDIANTSMDCMHCTAYLAENAWKLNYLNEHYPQQAQEVKTRLHIIRDEVMKDMANLERLL